MFVLILFPDYSLFPFSLLFFILFKFPLHCSLCSQIFPPHTPVFSSVYFAFKALILLHTISEKHSHSPLDDAATDNQRVKIIQRVFAHPVMACTSDAMSMKFQPSPPKERELKKRTRTKFYFISQ